MNTSLQHQAFSPFTQSLIKGATIGPHCVWSIAVQFFKKACHMYLQTNPKKIKISIGGKRWYKRERNARKRQYSITSSPGPDRFGIAAEQTATCLLGSGHNASDMGGAFELSVRSSRPGRTKSWIGVSNLSHHFCFSFPGCGSGSGLLGVSLVPSSCCWPASGGCLKLYCGRTAAPGSYGQSTGEGSSLL